MSNQNIDTFKGFLSKLDEKTISELKEYFEYCSDDGEHKKRAHREKRRFFISTEKFRSALQTLIGRGLQYDTSELLKILDIRNPEILWWEDLFDGVLNFGKKYFTNQEVIDQNNICIIDAPHTKNESISLIIPIETDDSFCYVLISRYGQVGIYDAQFNLRHNYDIFFNRTGIKRRVRNIWVKSAIYLEDSKCLIISAADKSLMFYDASTLCHKLSYLITGLTYTITSMAYKCSEGKNSPSELYLGDDHGGITILIFKQPRTQLLYRKIQDKLSELFWIDLQCILYEPFCDIKRMKRIHSWPVKRIYYEKETNSIISSSRDPNASIVIKHNKGIKDAYVFKYSQGINCFCIKPRFLATGSFDGKVNLWDPVITLKPCINYPKQDSSIIDVAILRNFEIVISLNKDSILKVFNIFNENCIQTVNLRFPSYAILGKLIQFGYNAICHGPAIKQFQFERLPIMPSRRPSGYNIESRRSSKISNSEFGDIIKFESVDNNDEKERTEENFNALDEKWNRSEIIVACCNHIAIIPINKFRNSQGEIFLPPPEKTYKPRKPSLWPKEEKDVDEGSFFVKTDTMHILSGIEEIKKDYKRISSSVNIDDLDLLLSKTGLKDVLEKDFVGELGMKSDMYMRLYNQISKEKNMKSLVSKVAPYSALDLIDPIEISFSKPLPLSKRMKVLTGLEYFTEPSQLLFNNRCFSMSSVRTPYSSVSSKNIQINDSSSSVNE